MTVKNSPQNTASPALRRFIRILRIPVFLLIVGGYLVFLFYLPPAPTIVVVHAKTEQISYVVTIPEMARIRMLGLGVRGETALVQVPASGRSNTRAPAQTSVGQNPRRLVCIGGLVQPTAGTRVTVRRTGDEPLRIVLERFDDKPAAEFRGQDAVVNADLMKASWLMVEQSETCGETPLRRLQISGLVEIGDELRPETSASEPASAPILEGRVEVYGKTVDLGWLWGDRRPRLYPVTEIAIPPGSRLTEAPGVGEPQDRQPWSGMVYVEADVSALQAEVTTEASALALFRPGSGLEPEILKVGIFAQLFNDPNILSIQIMLAMLVGILQVVMAFFSVKP
jgi:hypothetical protein